LHKKGKAAVLAKLPCQAVDPCQKKR